MIISELVEMLSKLPQDYQVFIGGSEEISIVMQPWGKSVCIENSDVAFDPPYTIIFGEENGSGDDDVWVSPVLETE